MINVFAIGAFTLITIAIIYELRQLQKRVHQLELDGLTERQKDVLIKMECENEYGPK